MPKLIFWLTWSALNFFWLALLRRPVVSAALSLAMIVVLILLSRLKYDIIWMTANFLDVMIINADTISFLLAVKPDLLREAVLAVVLIIPALVLLWRIDTFRMRPRLAATGFLACLAALLGIALTFEQEDWETFAGNSYVSKFSHSGFAAIFDLMAHGYLDAGATLTERLKTLPEATCTPTAKPPHIILVHDESSFDIRVAPGVKVPADYGGHFRSFDGKAAPLHRRRRRRAELVHRVQRARRTVRALVRTLCLLRDPDRRRPGRTRAADGAAPMRLPYVLDLSGARRLHERQELPDHDRDAEVSRPGCARNASHRAGPVLL